MMKPRRLFTVTSLMVISLLVFLLSWSNNSFYRLSPSGITRMLAQANFTQDGSGVTSRSNQSPTEHQVATKVEINLKTLWDSAKQNNECAPVLKDPLSFWRSSSRSKFTAADDSKKMALAFRCGILDEDYLSKPPHSTLYPHEQDYLSMPAATDLQYVTSPQKTRVSLYQTKTNVRVGDTVYFLIKAIDHAGRAKTIGGDEIRVWLKSGVNGIAAKVKDFGNGTYLATTKLSFVGEFRVKVAVAYSREYLRALAYVIQLFKSTRLYIAHFSNAKANEATPCYHTPLLPGAYPEVCNLTATNGSPWFCGRPSKAELSCSDFKGSHNGPVRTTGILPITDVENRLLQIPYNSADNFLADKTNLVITATEQDTQNRAKPCDGSMQCPYCSELPPHRTWDTAWPTGYLYGGQWHSFNCRIQSYDKKQCFENREVVLLGDSNLRMHYQHWFKMANCTSVLKALTKKWHKPMLCVNKQLNFTMRWEPHSQPFLNGGELAEVGSLVPSNHVIDKLSSDKNYVIVFDHYYHISGIHLSSLETKWRTIASSLEKFFLRNQRSVALLQSPYITWQGWKEHFGAGDMFGRHMIKLMYQIFSRPPLKDKIIFVPAWEITQVLESRALHPERGDIISKVMSNLICGRKL